MSTSHPRLRMESAPSNARVTPLELFFDLVFVFALTQVTALMADDLSPRGILRGLLILGLLWWSWTAYAWLSNMVRADEGAARIALLLAMLAMFILALAIPEAFDDLSGGLSGPVVVAMCYFLFRLMHLVLYWIISEGDAALRRQLVRFTPSMVGGTVLLLVASQYRGTVQTLFWALALMADYGGTYLAGARGWRLRSPGHFAERHGLILIVSLGESIVALGMGAAELPIAWPIVAGSLGGLVLSAALWWAYFDITALQAEHNLAGEPEETRPRLARDAYSFLHFPMVAGVILLALGLEKVLEQVGRAENHRLSQPLTGIGLYALFGGVVIYLLGHIAFKWRIAHSFTLDRLVAAAVLLLLLPVAGSMPALISLIVVTVVMLAVIVFETVRYAEERVEIRNRVATAGRP